MENFRLVFLASSVLAMQASPIDLSGNVTDLSGNSLAGAGVTLATLGNATSTNANGAWTISDGSAGIVSRATTTPGQLSSHLSVEGNRIRLRFQGCDASGRSTGTEQSAFRTANARETAVHDTLLLSWNGRVRARIAIASIVQGASGTNAIDTSTASADIPWSATIAYGTLTDPRDGQAYRTVSIGTQVWMAQNLNYKLDSSWCYESAVDSCVKYGRLYQWAAAMGIDNDYNGAAYSAGSTPARGECPSEWHLPDTAEWRTLANTEGGASAAGTALKSGNGWVSGSLTCMGTDGSGFHALPGGGVTDMVFTSSGNYAEFWSTTQYGSYMAWQLYIGCTGSAMYRTYSTKSDGYSVRCIQD